MSFLSYFKDVLQADSSCSFPQAHHGIYHQELLSNIAEVPISVFVGMILFICVPPLIALYFYKSNAAKAREEQPRGCRRLGMKTETNLSDEFDTKYAQGQPLCVSEVPERRWRVKSMWIYPVKSCKGVELDHADIVVTGMKYDRQFTFVQLRNPDSIVDASEKKPAARTWEFITQRKFPRLATVKVEMCSRLHQQHL